MSRLKSIKEMYELLRCLNAGVARSSGMAFHTGRDQDVLALSEDIHNTIAGKAPDVVLPAVLFTASGVVASVLSDLERRQDDDSSK